MTKDNCGCALCKLAQELVDEVESGIQSSAAPVAKLRGALEESIQALYHKSYDIATAAEKFTASHTVIVHVMLSGLSGNATMRAVHCNESVNSPETN